MILVVGDRRHKVRPVDLKFEPVEPNGGILNNFNEYIGFALIDSGQMKNIIVRKCALSDQEVGVDDARIRYLEKHEFGKFFSRRQEADQIHRFHQGHGIYDGIIKVAWLFSGKRKMRKILRRVIAKYAARKNPQIMAMTSSASGINPDAP